MTANLLQILVKKLISLILRNSAQILKIAVFFPHRLIPLLIRTYQILNSRHRPKAKNVPLRISSVNVTEEILNEKLHFLCSANL